VTVRLTMLNVSAVVAGMLGYVLVLVAVCEWKVFNAKVTCLGGWCSVL
jgi:hypothetical protein